MNNVGLGQGIGRNINIPWSLGSSSYLIGSDEYVYVFDKLLYPVCEEFKPDLVFISAGFDSAKGDPLGSCGVTPIGY